MNEVFHGYIINKSFLWTKSNIESNQFFLMYPFVLGLCNIMINTTHFSEISQSHQYLFSMTLAGLLVANLRAKYRGLLFLDGTVL